MSQRIGGYRKIDFTMSGTPAEDAVEFGHTRDDNDAGAYSEFDDLEIYVVNLTTGATVEIDLAKPGVSNPKDDADFLLAEQTISAVGFATKMTRIGWPGARIRGVSGSGAGNVEVYVTWK